MAYLISFFKGIAALVVAGLVTYYGLGILDRSSGFKGLVAGLVMFPLVIYSASYVADKITPGKLGSFGHTLVMVLVLACFGGVYKIKTSEKQAVSYQSTAAALGLVYQENIKLPPSLAKNPALQRGFMPEIKQALMGKYRGVETIIFNYEYGELSTDYEDHYLRTVVVFTDPKNKLPEFYMKPQNIGGRLFKRSGIYFKDDSRFSKRYHLSGPDEGAVRNLFTSSKREALVAMKGKWAVGSAEGHVVIYADDKMDEEVKPTPKEMGAYLEKARALYDVLSSAQSTSK